MKIEKINENQIRCTLTEADLSSRQIQLSELTYGSAKAKKLFHDMMRQAHIEVGFDSSHSPLMIEAIPTSQNSIVLLITKVEDPEELDTRFSRFTRTGDQTEETKPSIGADDILELFHKLRQAQSDKKQEAASSPKPPKQAEETAPRPAPNLVQAYVFPTIDDVIAAAHALDFYTGSNTLYRSDRPGSRYELILHQSDSSPEDFNRVCNILAEYGTVADCSPAIVAYREEKGGQILAGSALQQLSAL